jgi:hypothetical protein
VLSFLGRKAGDREPGKPPEPAPLELHVDGAAAFAFASHLRQVEGFAIPDWDAVYAWIDSIPDDAAKARAWTVAEHAWLLHLRDSLGPRYHLDETQGSAVLSTLEPRHARLALEFMDRTLKRILHVLEGIAEASPWGRDILIVFEDEETYYRYATSYFPDDTGEEAFSSGMHLSGPCSHYITTKGDLRAVEPTVAHEMTHGCLSHLPLPLWLNEGLAVNTEHRIAGAGVPLYTPAEMHARHQRFWGREEIQQFWSGRSFRRPDDGNMLSYDLARILVDQLSADWHAFAAFARSAHFEDGGAAAASEHMRVDLGEAVAAWLERDPEDYRPRPAEWPDAADTTPARPINSLIR